MRAYPDDERSRSVVVVEGPMDALAAAGEGYDSIALMGISPPPSTMKHVSKIIDGRPTVLVLDSEPAAKAAAMFFAVTLSQDGTNVKYAELQGAKDLAAMREDARYIFLGKCFGGMLGIQWQK
jgi:DNA primase